MFPRPTAEPAAARTKPSLPEKLLLSFLWFVLCRREHYGKENFLLKSWRGRKKAFYKIPILYSITYNGFYLDKIYLFLAEKFYFNFTCLCKWIDLKILGNYKPLIALTNTGIKTVSFIEANIIEGFVKLIVKILTKLSLIDLKAQNGNIQNYNAYAFIIITLVLMCLILGYITFLTLMGG